MFTTPMSTISLAAILDLIGVNKFCWSILYIWAVSRQESGLNVLNLEEKTKRNTGYQVEWDELVKISKNLDQVNECTIVAVNPSKQFPDRELPLDRLRELCDIVIEGFDSTVWEITVQNDELKRRLVKHFPNVN